MSVHTTPVEELTDAFLDLLSRHQTKATFFVVGELARKYPEVLKKISAEGHELGCHGDLHITLDKFDSISFASDIKRNRSAVEDTVGVPVQGFRAPLLSLTKENQWAYEVLGEAGFKYSSSVLPAPNPLFGWPDFGEEVRYLSGIWEIPITKTNLPFGIELPLYSGTYFRVLPMQLIKYALKLDKEKSYLSCYFHPYDIDYKQKWEMSLYAKNNKLHNALLYIGRKSLLHRLDNFLSEMQETMTYSAFISKYYRDKSI